jgi:tRNA (guanine10-N2)-methyltransferase
LEKIDKFDIFANFKHYGLPLPEFWVQDIHTPMVRMRGKFDAIVCDPPYGVRAMVQKVGMTEKKENKIEERK